MSSGAEEDEGEAAVTAAAAARSALRDTALAERLARHEERLLQVTAQRIALRERERERVAAAAAEAEATTHRRSPNDVIEWEE